MQRNSSRMRELRGLLVGCVVASSVAVSAMADEPLLPFRSLRAMGLGNAYEAVADDLFAFDYNPAGLANIDRFTFAIVPAQVRLSEDLADELENLQDLLDEISDLADEGLLPHKIRKFYSAGWNGDMFVNIDGTIDLKLKALRAHTSQMKDFDPEEMVRGWAAESAKGKEMDYAESFRIVTLVDDEAWQKVKEPAYWKDLLG